MGSTSHFLDNQVRDQSNRANGPILGLANSEPFMPKSRKQEIRQVAQAIARVKREINALVRAAAKLAGRDPLGEPLQDAALELRETGPPRGGRERR